MTTQSRIIENKRARFDYEIVETVETGLVLTGQEVKAFRSGQVTLLSAFVRPLVSSSGGQTELWLINAHFSHSDTPTRSRKLLLHRREIDRLIGKVGEKGLTLVPLKLYLKGKVVKLLVGLGRGRKQFEKREVLKKRDVERELRRGASS